MFEELEKKYIKSSPDYKFRTLYWIYSIFILGIITTLRFLINYSLLLSIILELLLLLLFVLLYYKYTLKKLKIKASFLPKINDYTYAINKQDIEILKNLLKSYNIKKKDELNAVIDYYKNKQYVKMDTSFFAWIPSAAITIASLIQIAYDPIEKTIDETKLNIIFSSTLGYTISIILIIFVFKTTINIFIIPKKQIYTKIYNNLLYIYFNNKKRII